MTDYDKELINSRITEVCDYYLPGEGRSEGQRRRIWPCPVCGKDSFSANDSRGYAGCFSTCSMPRTNDAVAVIAYFEGLQQSGRDFISCLQKGYEILDIPEPEDEPANRDGAGGADAGGGEDSSPSSGTKSPSQEATQSPASTTAVSEPESQPAHKPSDGSPSTVASASSLALLQSLQNGYSQNGSSQNGSTAEGSTTEEQSTGETAEDGAAEEEGSAELDPAARRELIDQVYRAMLELCPLIERDRQFWILRGVYDETMKRCGLGSLSRERCKEVLPELERRFGREALTSVPGFYVSKQGRVQTNLYDDYTLIPYYDRDGYITMVQGRVPGTPEGDKPKYMAPVNSGLHLYVPPGYKPEGVMAFVEGAVGAIVAAQSGIPVAAITGYQHYRIAGARGEADRPLPEHERTDFGRRKILYIPDEDVKPGTKDSVQKEAPKAARALIEAHNGTPLIARLPEGYKDLDEWLLDLEPDERTLRFSELMKGAMSPEQWSGEENGEQTEDRPKTDRTKDEQKKKITNQEVHKTQEKHEEDGSADDRPTEEKSRDREEESQSEQEETSEQQSPPPQVKTPEAQPRTYRRVPITNVGEFMVGLFCGLLAGLGFLILIVFLAPAWGPTSFVSLIPGVFTLLASFFVGTVVLVYACRKLYLRRVQAIREHLAGKR